MNKKLILSLLVVLAILLGILTSCGSMDTGTTSREMDNSHDEAVEQEKSDTGTGSRETELTAIQNAVDSMMIDTGITTLPNPVTTPTDDMKAFPDTSVCGVDKIDDFLDSKFVKGKDKDGYILYGHDMFGDSHLIDLVNYIATDRTIYKYTVDKHGNVTQHE